TPSLLMRAPDETITRCNERCDIHVGTAPRVCTRRGRPEMAPARRTSVCTFFRALLQRAVEALLQRGAIPLSYARSHPIEPEMGRDRAAAGGRRRATRSPSPRSSHCTYAPPHGGLNCRRHVIAPSHRARAAR